MTINDFYGFPSFFPFYKLNPDVKSKKNRHEIKGKKAQAQILMLNKNCIGNSKNSSVATGASSTN